MTCSDCEAELLTMASQNRGRCSKCEARRRDRERADRLSRDVVVDMIDDETVQMLREGKDLVKLAQRRRVALDYIQVKAEEIMARMGWAPESQNRLDMIAIIEACKEEEKL